MPIRAAVDIGGTFTDVVAYHEQTGELLLGKALSTPRDLIQGVFDGLAAADVPLDEIAFLIHGSTIVVNALIERRGARTALVTTAGFRDVYEIGRINRPDAFNLSFTRHRPLVPREMVFEVPERIAADGTVMRPLDEQRARSVARKLAAQGVEAVAVALLHAYRNPAHERRLGQILREELPGAYVTLSHEISREYREFERTSTVVANAFVGPIVSAYLGRLDQRLRQGGARTAVAVMQSNGGVSDVATASTQCVQMLESGPAGGVVGTIALCEALGYREAIAFDMGGTTAKSAVIRDLTFPVASDYFLGGYRTGLPIRIPCLDIVEIGTGGGSVAWLDEAGGIHVGPRSAGAEPGPACFGRGGTEPTITDAAVVLGHLAPDGRLSGDLPIDGDAAHRVVQALAHRLGLDTVTAAAGIIAIGAAAMANAVRAVTTERGLDPRDFALFAYGGNGPLHISLVARELGVTRVVIPPVPAVFSALGMLMADARLDLVQTRVRTLGSTEPGEIEQAYRTLEAECAQQLHDSAIGFDQVEFLRAADMRYVGQEHTVTLPAPPLPATAGGDDALRRAFDAAHEQRYSHSAPGEPAQVVSLRVSAVGKLSKPDVPKVTAGDLTPPAPARTGTRDVVFDPADGGVPTAVYDRARLLAGNRIAGPAAIEEPTTTTLLRPGDTARVDEFGNLLVEIGG
ncbi:MULTISPECIES: hydantoinase/oxoprolinase family protein [Micromonospora]|uniref:Hydantoinase/oxoprolinase family protein n=1 Tax=Micromonospora solifontis TaxID=2487138 RepID=A0ABX9WDF3_9ACTN|nr:MULTISPECIES: hydantoinase/oxoprolinase family protein [Micromonospora]NES15196.1 hydantoinase/oxoprolinase family protein [Micromonospora sp. PPF5-17B]NES38138.1 hydantoinase/oxoprolinase family protein [Micromonospora solifontis]NES56531.1 hydantoinase/oxoprolinase family protein [Micromonospora sp. PPF5-6]RNL96995.1 hydantoinase/oxoprolinase family protein [Micromonospora solifontis]